MRNAVAATFWFAFGIVFAVPGVLLALWVVVRLLKIEQGFDLAMWAAAHWPYPLTAPPMELANQWIQTDVVMQAAVVSFVLCSMGFGALRYARQVLRPANESHDGKARVEWKTARPQVGRPLEGRLLPANDVEPGEVFRLELTCVRRYRIGTESRDDRTETAFGERQDIKAVPGAHGCSVPFRFDIPVTMPASGVRGVSGIVGDRWAGTYEWQLAFYRTDTVIAFPSKIALTLAAAPPEELRALEASESPALKETIDAIADNVGRAALLPHERAKLKALSPEDLAQARKVTGMIPGVPRWVVIAVIAFFLGVPLAIFLVGIVLVTLSGNK